MNAIITNMLEARAEKVFARWTRAQLEDRIAVLVQYDEGWDNPAWGKMMEPLAFPNGFDPSTHPEDSIELLHAELQRRERS